MKLYGRITVYGEYLMHKDNPGLIMPSELFIETCKNEDINSTYSEDKDEVLSILKQKGIFPFNKLTGNLPLGYGMAGSTILSLLHLNQISSSAKSEIVKEIDSQLHGFTPSGLDIESSLRQNWGLFCTLKGWENVSPLSIRYSLVKFPKEKRLSLDFIQKKVISNTEYLEPIQKNLNKIIRKENRLDLSLLLQYSSKLNDIGVYSKNVNEFISRLLNEGIIAKGIGGLYDKLVVIIYSKKSDELQKVEKILRLTSGQLISN